MKKISLVIAAMLLFSSIISAREMVIYKSTGETWISVNEIDSIKFFNKFIDTFQNLSQWQFSLKDSAKIESGMLKLSSNVADSSLFAYSKDHYMNTGFTASCDASMGSFGPYQEASFGVTYYDSKDSSLGQIMLSIRKESGSNMYELRGGEFLKVVTNNWRKQGSYNWNYDTVYNLKIVKTSDSCSFYINNKLLESSQLNNVKFSYLRITIKAYESIAKFDNVQFE